MRIIQELLINSHLEVKIENELSLPFNTNIGVIKYEACRRKQLGKVIGVSYPQHISNETLYKRCKSERLGMRMTKENTLLSHEFSSKS